MTKLGFVALVAALACTAALTVSTTPADARSGYYCCYRPWVNDPGYRRYKFFRSPPRQYRSACAYGDCACIRSYALRTKSPVWWDRYTACAGS